MSNEIRTWWTVDHPKNTICTYNRNSLQKYVRLIEVEDEMKACLPSIIKLRFAMIMERKEKTTTIKFQQNDSIEHEVQLSPYQPSRR